MLRLIFLYVFSCCTLLCNSQELTNVTSSQGITHSFTGSNYGAGTSFYDFNKDGWDDLTLPNYSSDNMFYVNNNGTFENITLLEEDRNFKSLIWVDFDNDGDADLSYTELDGLFGIYENIGDLELVEFDLNYTPAEDYGTDNYGISWGDYDQNGFLDFYVSRYVDPNAEEFYPNLLFKNNGDGTFSEVSELLGVGNGEQQTFISSWFDSDLDGDLDLHLANDRTIYDNALYRNDGDNFADISESSNTDINIFAMSSTIGDYDNDGDFDIYCSNGFAGNHLMRNEGNNEYTDLFPNSGAEAWTFAWGAKWIDINNNGWKDLYVCSGANFDNYNRLYINNQDGTFDSDAVIPNDFEDDTHSAAKGDFNNDGFYDLIISNEAPFNSRLFENSSSSSNNFVKVTLEGVQSNKDGIGTRLNAFIGDRMQTEFTFCGTDFLSQDSQHIIFGLGQDTLIDSLKITWPLGLEEWIYEIDASENLHFTEGENIHVSLNTSGVQTLCTGDSIGISLSENSANFSWNNGEEQTAFFTNEPGEYYATVLINDFFSVNSDTVSVVVGSYPEVLSESIDSLSCFDSNDGFYTAEILLETDSIINFLADSLGADTYTFLFTNSYNCSTEVEFIIPGLDPLESNVITENVLCFGESSGTVSLEPSGGTPPYFIEFTGGYDPLNLAAGGPYEFIVTDENGCQVADDFMIFSSAQSVINVEVNHAFDETLGSIIISTTIDTPIITINGETASEEILNLEPGDYELIIIDENGCESVFNETIQLTDNVINLTETVNVYPTPFTSELILEGIPVNSQIVIHNSLSKLVHSSQNSHSTHKIITDRLTPGIYYLKLVSPQNQIHYQKIVKL